MREILFRGKRIDNGQWIEGAFLNDRDGAFYICPAVSDITYGDNGNRRRIGCWYKVGPATVDQYTGLTDENGKRIFEGDIVEYNDGFDYFKGEIVFENGAFGIAGDEIMGYSEACCDNFASLWQLLWNQDVTDEPVLYDCTVVGNIHDNPELLGVADNGIN